MKIVVVTKSSDVPRVPVDGKPTLVYWEIVGWAQQIRLLLVYLNVDFVDVRIVPGDPVKNPSQYKQAWLQAKPTLDDVMAFPNLPFFMDGDIVLSQSDAISRYIERRYTQLRPPHDAALHDNVSIQKLAMVDLVLDELKDLEVSLARIAYDRTMTSEQARSAMSNWMEGLPSLLKRFRNLFGDGDFLSGTNTVSIGDFKLYVFLSRLQALVDVDPSTMPTAAIDSLSEWLQYRRRIEELPPIKRYLERPDYLSRPVYNPYAKINN